METLNEIKRILAEKEEEKKIIKEKEKKELGERFQKEKKRKENLENSVNENLDGHLKELLEEIQDNRNSTWIKSVHEDYLFLLKKKLNEIGFKEIEDVAYEPAWESEGGCGSAFYYISIDLKPENISIKNLVS